MCIDPCQNKQAVREKIQETIMSSKHKVCIIGYYGIGGIGKTTMCKTLCNELSEFEGKVCHIELAANRSLVELLKEVLKNLTSTSEELLQQLNEGEVRTSHLAFETILFIT
jgi:tetraacyldisaccharide-1-P 4'-kinase